ncbi:MAG TPA: SPFH domain-containing protein [Chloroflexota bacterium]|nr:SPFH domain-containing protein [Chloroflexota bacterium]
MTTSFIAVVAAVVFLMILSTAARTFRKVGPNQALIVYGWGGTRVVTGGGALVLPFFQSARDLTLELMSFDVAPQQDLYTRQGVAVNVEAVAQLKVRSDATSVRTAAEQLLTKSPDERQEMIKLVMSGHLRGIVGQLTVEEIVKQPEMVSEKMRMTCAEDLTKMGLEVISFTIKEVRDQNQYIANMGRPDVARIRRDAEVATAEAARDIQIKQAIAAREAAVAKAQADQERVLAETTSQGQQAEATRDMELKKAAYQIDVQKAKAQADASYSIQEQVQKQQIVAEQVHVERIQREEQIKVQDAEIVRRERELTATVQKQAEADRNRIETLAEAEKSRKTIEAAGVAEAIRAQGQAEAEVTRLRGTAEADVIRVKGEAEAEAMRLKAEAFEKYGQAAILDKIVTGLPAIAEQMAAPLANVDRITVVATDGTSAGVNRVTADVARMVAQAPELIETLTGQKISTMLQQLGALKAIAPAESDNGHPPPAETPTNGH